MQKRVHFNWFVVTVVIVLGITGFTRCMDRGAEKTEGNAALQAYEEFAGSNKCVSCHTDIYNKHIQTAHYQTSAPATHSNIAGSFDNDKNSITYPNGSVIKMEEKDGKFYQVAYMNGVEAKRQPMDIVIGSGKKGQSYASWNQVNLVQLPVTYFTQAQQWCNSPGYPNKIAFNRPITSRCLECHTTYAGEIIEKPSSKAEGFKESEIIYGVTCEKCHGPGAKHVDYQAKNPADTTGRFILNPRSFTRDQSLDLCALCHGGKLEKTKPSFSYTAGEKLSAYFNWDTTAKVAGSIDVHGNQLGLLKSSSCFLQSATLTCNNCHSLHENNDLSTYSQKCMDCHSTEHGNFCTEKSVSLEKKKNNCIDCHMPKQASRSIAVVLPGQNFITPTFIRTHHIAKYVEDTKKFIEGIENKKNRK